MDPQSLDHIPTATERAGVVDVLSQSVESFLADSTVTRGQASAVRTVAAVLRCATIADLCSVEAQGLLEKMCSPLTARAISVHLWAWITRRQGRPSGSAPTAERGIGSTELVEAHLDAGAVFLVSIDQGTTENLAVSTEGRRAALAAGLVLGAGVRLSRRWRLALDIQGLRAVAGADFVVDFDSGRKPVLPPPTWQGIVCAKLEFVAWP